MTDQTATHPLESGNHTAIQDAPRRPQRPRVRPTVDVLDRAEELVLLVDLPGVASDAVDLELENGVLTLTARAEAPARDGLTLRHGEFAARDYARRFTLDTERVETGEVTASLQDGVLRVTLPKQQPTRHRIEVLPG